MGEIADMIIEGVLCEQCGAYVGDEVGFPRSCPDCERERTPKVKCAYCSKMVAPSGMLQHHAAKHARGTP